MPSLPNVKPKRQTPGFCGPCSLAMVLGFYGVRSSETELARLAHASRVHGVDAQGLSRAARAKGFTLFIKSHAALTDITALLDSNIPPIVDWFSVDDGHYSVVTRLTRTHITLADPEMGKTRRLDRNTFFRVWFDFPEAYLRTKNDLHIRHLIAVVPQKNISTPKRLGMHIVS